MTRIVSRSDALSRGISDAELQRYCRTRAWRRLRPGRFVSRDEFDALPREDKHRVITEAVFDATIASDAVVSHVSAAVFHGLDVWNADLSRVHITRNRARGGGRSSAVRAVHTSPYTDEEVVDFDGVRVTALARTVADCARSLPFETAVCIADFAAGERGLAAEDVVAALDSCPNHPGNRLARRVAEFMDGRSESVGESRTRVVLHQLGYTPQLQVPITDSRGFVGRVDFNLPDIETVLEFDGKVKYGRYVPEGKSAADVLWEEKRREDRIRATGRQVVRIAWSDLDRPELVDRMIRDAADRAGRRHRATLLPTARPSSRRNAGAHPAQPV
ncbi:MULTISPECIES: hypothetical protein [unclassified Rhodococcus (in: high G+C Gram-positive bacteria)]|uniref:type IV toxin-antitoxin system AbiEi family antitoxin domain-containing protein n=1 Tax=unclassified Rhodococcus (in: high G+C Gram-positive bacteria) TaxID=192944 RepID=UPI000B9B4AC3|nr:MULTISPECIES: hypothetical protein [unclassified Rhodococcus (in: high G+C Gram-positive bacteria)]OZE34263.1 hypothetical protein CH259_19850 [Rhodococcus sp. 05-2254-4]OZE51461.1 hypothetical protein CH261_02535 [Rhodococcus sp. 05-2254-3]OZE53111.1 hypothetical protein CH283_07625 [Rhodococcus sp. 05-2254-2]